MKCMEIKLDQCAPRQEAAKEADWFSATCEQGNRHRDYDREQNDVRTSSRVGPARIRFVERLSPSRVAQDEEKCELRECIEAEHDNKGVQWSFENRRHRDTSPCFAIHMARAEQ